MTRMTGPDCAVMCNLINTHTNKNMHNTHKKHKGITPGEDHCEYCRVTMSTGPGCMVVCKLVNNTVHTKKIIKYAKN